MAGFKLINKASQSAKRLSLSVLLLLGFSNLSCTQASRLTDSLPAPLSSHKIRISGQIPVSVKVPSHITDPVQARPFFDYFSWESFIALNWPLDPVTAKRGIPLLPDDPKVFYAATTQTPVVWTDYKESYELFGQGDVRPSPWNSYRNRYHPCDNIDANANAEVKRRHLYNIAMSAEVAELNELDQAFSYPLIDQNGNLVYYEVVFNKAQFDFVRGNNDDETSWLYLAKNLAAHEPVQMPASHAAGDGRPREVGAIMIKAAWKELTMRDNADRFYSIQSEVYNPNTNQCETKNMGLIGLHIAQKLEEFPQWIWSTFEQVDNVPGVEATLPYSLNNGTNSPRTIDGFANRPPSKASTLQPNAEGKYAPVQVTRYNPIPKTPPKASTQDLNRLYQHALKGTVWEYYQLVVTQWPSNPTQFTYLEDGGIYPQDAGGAFPVNNAVNTAIETYFQSQNDAIGGGNNSCMSCHYQADQADFSWVLRNRAHSGTVSKKQKTLGVPNPQVKQKEG